MKSLRNHVAESRSTVVGLTGPVLALGAALLLFSSALAQDGTPTPPVELVVTEQIGYSSRLFESMDSAIVVAFLLIVAAAGLFWLIFQYLTSSRDAYYKASKQMLDTGWTPVPVAGNVIAYVNESQRNEALSDLTEIEAAIHSGDQVKEVPIQLDGPSEMAVGSFVEYKLVTTDPAGLPGELKLSVASDSTGKAEVLDNDANLARFVLHATGIGTLNIQLKTSTGTLSGSWAIAVVRAPEPVAAKIAQLYVFGLGSHTLILVTLVVFVLVLLALDRVLTGEAVASILGVLVGYLFGVNTKSGGGEAPQPQAPPAPGP